MPYPDAPRLGLVEDLGGHRVADPYRWLEDQDDPEVRRWLADQAALFARHRDRWAARDHLRRRLEALTPGVVGLPRACGDRIFFARRLRGQDQAVWVVAEPDGTERVVLDPARLSEDGTVVLQWAAPSPEGRHLAYAVDEGGREEAIVRIIEVDSGEVDSGAEVGPALPLGRGGNLAWMAEGAGLIRGGHPARPGRGGGGLPPAGVAPAARFRN